MQNAAENTCNVFLYFTTLFSSVAQNHHLTTKKVQFKGETSLSLSPKALNAHAFNRLPPGTVKFTPMCPETSFLQEHLKEGLRVPVRSIISSRAEFEVEFGVPSAPPRLALIGQRCADYRLYYFSWGASGKSKSL